MPKRFTDGVFALGLVAGGCLTLFLLVWVVGLNYCPNSPCKYANYPNEVPPRYEYWVPFATGPDTTSFFEPEDSEDHPKYHDRQDLRAQETMARATNAIVWLTSISLILGMIGAGLIYWTLVETRRLTKDTREIGHAQVRAYVHLENMKVTPRADSNCLQICFEIHNLGNSPAKNFSYCYFISLRHHPTQQAHGSNYFRENEPQYPDFPRNLDKRIKAGGCERVRHLATDFSFTAEEVAFFEDGTLWVEISIATKFEDVFGETISDIEHFHRLGGLIMNNEASFSPISYSTHSKINHGS